MLFLAKRDLVDTPTDAPTLKSGNYWQGQEIVTVLPGLLYVRHIFINGVPLLLTLLPIKTLFEMSPQGIWLRIVYMMEDFSHQEPHISMPRLAFSVRTNSTGFVTVFFILSEINYDFAGKKPSLRIMVPTPGSRSNIIKTSSAETMS